MRPQQRSAPALVKAHVCPYPAASSAIAAGGIVEVVVDMVVDDVVLDVVVDDVVVLDVGDVGPGTHAAHTATTAQTTTTMNL